MSYINELIEKDFREIPEYAFTVKDVIEEMGKKGLPIPSANTVRYKLKKRVEAGELVFVKVANNLTYYVPKELAKNAEIDEEAILAHGE